MAFTGTFWPVFINFIGMILQGLKHIYVGQRYIQKKYKK